MGVCLVCAGFPTLRLSVRCHQAETQWCEQLGSAAALVLTAQERWERAMKCDLESCEWWD